TSRTIHAKEEHADLAIGADGNDYAVFVDYGNGGNLVMADLATGARTTLFSIYNNGTSTGYHLSAKSFARPGWILMETHRESNANLLANRLMAVELKANPTIINLAHHQSYQNGFWTQPQATVSRDFSRVLFGSNWGTTSNLDIDAFMIRLPDNLLEIVIPKPTDTKP
ncbi:hypothetical protein, partial [Aerolutibacter ruishenii]|uniref:hypothetical protein n=1 Tax=Aerolutibacter ruishenii TaxID=686800 RepID=UPI001A7E99A5